MGIRCLTAYAKYGSRLEDLHLKDTTVVVDLANFLWGTLENKIPLLNRPCPSLSHGGGYRAYKHQLNELFVIFRSCNIHCIFVADGASSITKTPENSSATLDDSDDSDNSDNSENIPDNTLKPILMNTLFYEAVLDFKHQIYCHDDEGDFIIGRLALHFNVPVIAADSDFHCFYYENNSGYIPFTTLRYQRTFPRKNFMTCKIFKSDQSGNSPFGYSMKLHWAIPIFCKNDYETKTKCLIRSNCNLFCDTKEVDGDLSPYRIVQAVNKWLQNVHQSNETIEYDLNSSKKIIKREIRKVVENSVHKYIDEFVDEVFNQYTCQNFDNWEKLIGLISYKHRLVIDPEAHNPWMVRSPYFHLDNHVRQMEEKFTSFGHFESADLPSACILSKALRLTLYQLTSIELQLKGSMKNKSSKLIVCWLQRIGKEEYEYIEYELNITEDDKSVVNNLLSVSRDYRKEKFLYYLLQGYDREIDLDRNKIFQISKKYSCWFLMFLISLGIWRSLTSSPSKDKLTRTLLISVIYIQIRDNRVKSIYRNKEMVRLPDVLLEQLMDFMEKHSRNKLQLTNDFMSTIIHPIREWEYIFLFVGCIHNFFYNPFAEPMDGIFICSPYPIFDSRTIFNIMSTTTVDDIKEMSSVINEIYGDLLYFFN
ncbi:hypothetical protein SNEBB_007351 [Seison nebaliae]|nr:hypothetical protein SNEBB_007351 [Seison nebaliae]